MDRKTFLKRSIAVGFGAASGGAAALAQTVDPETNHERRFKEAWVEALMKNLEARFDEEERVGLMVANGRACARRGALTLAESCRGDVGGMVAKLKEIPDLEIGEIGEGTYRVVYGKCFCELVWKGPARLPDTYCECSRGWLLEMFGTAAERKVEVEIVQTIKRGGDACIFNVRHTS